MWSPQVKALLCSINPLPVKACEAGTLGEKSIGRNSFQLPPVTNKVKSFTLQVSNWDPGASLPKPS